MVALPLPIAHHLNPRHWLGWNGMKTYRNIQIGEGFNVFYSTSGDKWMDCTGWLSDQDECEWLSFSFDDVCNNDDCFLELAMVDNNLDGTMPVELALLSDSLCKCIHFGPVCCFG
jgi:hypothetical protein